MDITNLNREFIHQENSVNINNKNIIDGSDVSISFNSLPNITETWHIMNEYNHNMDENHTSYHISKTQADKINHTKNIYFNENSFPSDLQGELKGNVFYAQSSIIPAINNIKDDIHPNLVTGRKTLLLFKPHDIIQSDTEIKLNVYDNKNNLLHSSVMLSPEYLPKIAGVDPYYTNISPEYFERPISSDICIEEKYELEQIINDKIKLKEIIKMNETDITHIVFSDVILKKPFILNSDPDLSNKSVALTSYIKDEIEINYGIKKILLPPNETIHFVCDSSGQWVTYQDALLSKQHFSSLLASSKLSVKPSLHINEKEEIKKISINNCYLNNLISDNDTIKISIDNFNWVKNITLTTNRDFSSKKIIFTSKSQSVSEILHNNKITHLKYSDEILFECDSNGKWLKVEPNINEPSIILDIAYPEKFSLTLDTNEKIKKFATINRTFIDLLNKNNSIKVATSNYNWAKNFSLTENDSFHNKKILFTSTAAYTSTIKYGNKNINLKRNESVLFIYDYYHKWMTINDYSIMRELANIQYIEHGWSTTLPANIIKPGIKFEFNSQNKKGILKNIQIDAPHELLMNTIDIGMLTPPRNNFKFQDNPELNRQYFQTIPVSQLIVSRFEPLHITKVVMPDGSIFTEKSSGDGGYHSGNMRESIGKNLISDGINLANYGINSSSSFSETFLPTSQITLHNSIGSYKNGIIVHGLSGGGGKATLEDSDGNEFSHEIGHNFNLGHYEGGFNGGIHSAPDKRNSTWGWDSLYNNFIPNFEVKKTDKATYLEVKKNNSQAQPPYRGRSFNRDAMSGGKPYDFKYNRYTLYTPYTLASIQKDMTKRHIFSIDSNTGFKKWNYKTAQMDDSSFDITDLDSLDMHFKNGVDIQKNDLEKLLSKSNLIHITIGNGYHTSNIYIPNANESNKNSVIKINSYASWDSQIHLTNGIQKTLKQNDQLFYISNGFSWQEINEYRTYKKPDKQGIPIVTLLGYYDPENKIDSYIYPSLYGSYGMTYNPNKNAKNKNVYIDVTYHDNTHSQHQLIGYRKDKNLMNKFHINLERDRKPTKANLYIDGKIIYSRDIEIKENRLPTTINGIIV
ncbi:MAG: hypothetical protein KA732_04985 [Providencia sp.]|uniref:M66 family metalloprotease n=2 Tax=Providencia sp. TaxID=589 RepID=UPI001B430A71|nr:M66 family metalloprotease [Providencia sp.]MBP6080616.1 hypothetical protein [Providencia sp.]